MIDNLKDIPYGIRDSSGNDISALCRMIEKNGLKELMDKLPKEAVDLQKEVISKLSS